MPTSNASEPILTSAGSPDTLPLTGFTCDQLKNYIIRQLGGPTYAIELTNQQILDHIQNALGLYSQWVPNIKVGSLVLIRGQHKYLQGVSLGLGIAKVDFVEPMATPTDLFFAGLINPAPLFRTGLDEYDTFLRWRKTWMRVTSIKPDWFYDDVEQCLYIHNPVERYQAGIFCYWPHERTEKLSYTGADWVKRYALAACELQLGKIFSKYSGAIPGIGQNLQLDQQKRELAQAEIDKLMEGLRGMQISTPFSID